MSDTSAVAPDISSMGSAILRAMHVRLDPPPHVLEDDLGLQLAGLDGIPPLPPGMTPDDARGLRASIVARARFVEDLVRERLDAGVCQYVVLGAGLDTFVQRHPDLAARLQVFEVDRPGPQAWKRRRLNELGFAIPASQRFVPVDFEAGASWWDELVHAGFDRGRPAIAAANGVAMHISRDAVVDMVRSCARLAPGSTLVLSFALPPVAVGPEERSASTRTLTTFGPDEVLALAREAGFREARQVTSAELARRYFAGRDDDLRPGTAQDLLVATT